jgi:hypothetical protein
LTGFTRYGVTMITEFRLVAAEPLRTEQRAQDRQAAEERCLLDRIVPVVAEQAADHEALAGAELHGRFGAAGGQRGNSNPFS